ncbi:MAG TPA: large conductance mechanosensitive channel protein MscL [Bacteroidales bacterium]|jgi:large conductance mechanosensitive channel|nr:large conductance mechanosensitive channel protein MscL [Bacteroidales bacterium]
MKIIKEFKEFAVKGNMMDMAIGIIVGTAFGRIITSLVEDVIMPPFGYLLGRFNFATLKVILKEAEYNDAGIKVRDSINLNYGNFIQVFLNFIIIAVAIFFFIKLINMVRRKANDPENTSIPTPKDIELLSEIRDLLKEQNKNK